MTLYRIRDWKKHFENHRTRELKTLSWVPFPNKHDGDGFTELLDHPNGVAHYGAWCLLVQVASKCDERGTLKRDTNETHNPASLARMTRTTIQLWEEVLPRLVKIGWIEICDESGAIPRDGAEKRDVRPRNFALNGMEGNGTEGNHHPLPLPEQKKEDEEEGSIAWCVSEVIKTHPSFRNLQRAGLENAFKAIPKCDRRSVLRKFQEDVLNRTDTITHPAKFIARIWENRNAGQTGYDDRGKRYKSLDEIKAEVRAEREREAANVKAG